MRTFTSYGSIDKELNYYAPRNGLIEKAYCRLIGEKMEKGGHYITVWASRQTGKTWIMQQVVKKVREQDDFEVAIITMQSAKTVETDKGVLRVLVKKMEQWFDRRLPEIDSWDNLEDLFSNKLFEKPLILILDEFDALKEDFINKFANGFRDMYIGRQNEADKPSDKKNCMLHGLALICIRSVLGIENVSGSPFNVQRSVHIPNLTCDEVAGLFKDYEKESGQKIETGVVEKLFCETRGQPGLTCWLGELLTETYNKKTSEPIRMRNFEIVSAAAIKALPNNNILNIISKANKEPFKSVVLDLFRTEKKTEFSYDDSLLNYLYQNGVIDRETENEIDYYARFASPFVQKRLFNYFARELFRYPGKTSMPFDDLSNVITRDMINVKNLMRRYEIYLKENRGWMLKDAPKRKDMRIFEAVYHFNLYRYLYDFLDNRHGRVWPEFPTGNGKVDLIIQYAGLIYAMELKSFTDEIGYEEALLQAASYGKQLNLAEVSLVFFLEYIDDANREKFEKEYNDKETGVRVIPVFVETGN
ncbi:AAA-like domain-containing protein [Desulfobacterales bacterium HSG16]|nr:AAA-like domain-containing protein [Desulfobacterales bacterium HSG16]